MEKFAQLGADIAKLWSKYGTSHYLPGIRNTLILALVATLIGCVIGFVCGVLNTIPHSKNDPPVKRFFLALVRAVVRIYVEVFRGTPMVLQAVFLYYGLPYFTDNAVKFNSIWAAAIVVVSVNTGAYMAESVRGGIISIDPGQTEGAMAIGMTLGDVHHRLPGFLLRAPGGSGCQLPLLPLCHGGNGGLSHHDADCLLPAASAGKASGRQ